MVSPCHRHTSNRGEKVKSNTQLKKKLQEKIPTITFSNRAGDVIGKFFFSSQEKQDVIYIDLTSSNLYINVYFPWSKDKKRFIERPHSFDAEKISEEIKTVILEEIQNYFSLLEQRKDLLLRSAEAETSKEDLTINNYLLLNNIKAVNLKNLKEILLLLGEGVENYESVNLIVEELYKNWPKAKLAKGLFEIASNEKANKDIRKKCFIEAAKIGGINIERVSKIAKKLEIANYETQNLFYDDGGKPWGFRLEGIKKISRVCSSNIERLSTVLPDLAKVGHLHFRGFSKDFSFLDQVEISTLEISIYGSISSAKIDLNKNSKEIIAIKNLIKKKPNTRLFCYDQKIKSLILN